MIAAGVRTPLVQPGEADRTNGDVWIVPTDNQPPTVLENRYLAQDWYPSNLWSDMEWSPDGTRLAIIGVQGTSSQSQGIIEYSLADGETRLLAETGGARHVSWSPDGARIAFESRSGSTSNPTSLRVLPLDASGAYTLASGYDSPSGTGPVWSPTGDQIVFQRDCYGSEGEDCPYDHEVILITPEGEEVVLPDLRLPGDERIWLPSRVTWSPDGNHLLYLAWVDEPDEETRYPQALIARPIDPETPPIVLYQPPTPLGAWRGDISSEGFQLASQSWGRPVLP
jgi:Tol biopolymer transport system component